MSIVSDKLGLLEAGRAKIEDAGLRPFQVFVQLRQYSEGEVYFGDLETEEYEITPRPEVIKSGRGYVLDGITPNYSGGGWTPQQLLPAITAGRQLVYRVVGPDGVDKPFQVTDEDRTSAFAYRVTLGPLDRSEPDLEYAEPAD